ncbi:hypothetical protein EJV44_04505 [Ancylobacter aquaticus]|nr:hypothetical protein EJV44_04505 [Ancylobacter aquaticus]
MSEITVTHGGRKYHVTGEGRDATVCVAVRHPGGDGLRTINYGTATWRAVVKQAAYARSLTSGAR